MASVPTSTFPGQVYNSVNESTPQASQTPAQFSDPSRLAPADVYTNSTLREPSDKRGGRSRSRRRKGVWKKLLWIKQSYPDNYTDPPTFLSHLQRNPRLVPYDFWPLVADSTVIVQHVCSIAIFVCCFVGIYQERVSPLSVVGWGSACTVLGWVLWDIWIGQEEKSRSLYESTYHQNGADELAGEEGGSMTSSFGPSNPAGSSSNNNQGLGLTLSTSTSSFPSRTHSNTHSRNLSVTSLHTPSSATSPVTTGHSPAVSSFLSHASIAPYNAPASSFSPRNQQRLATAKSAILIYCALLGLSPILQSLTQSTTSDSIWAMSTWLICINVFFFDYGGGVGAKFPASLSTNAALMASTVLASRLTSTTSVFSLTLFSIEVFGLFPVFRRHLRYRSWRMHVALTVLLIVTAGVGLGVILVGAGVWKAAVSGVIVWGMGNILAMGGCSWWLIGLQRYKFVLQGPWDPARPIIRAGDWD